MNESRPIAVRPRRRIPGPRGWRHLWRLISDPLGGCQELTRDYGGIVRFRLGHLDTYLINSPRYVRHILQDHASNYSKDVIDYQLLKGMLGESLLTSEGEYWKRQRRLSQPTFQRKNFDAFGHIISEAVEQLAARWQGFAATGQELDVLPEMSRLALQVVGRTMFSTDLSAEATAVNDALATASSTLDGFGMYSVLALIPLLNRRFLAAQRTIDELVARIIAEHRRPGAGFQDILSVLLQFRDPQTSRPLTPLELRNEVMTLLVAGHETTATNLSWALYLLAMHPVATERLVAEVLRLGDRPLAHADLAELPWTRCVVEESLRLYPPVWVLPRTARECDWLDDYLLPRGAYILMNSYVVQRDPAWWEQPEEFRPERFLPENEAKLTDFAHFPFGGGPRTCIGASFSMLEAQLVVARLTQRFHFEVLPNQRIEPTPGVTLRPRYGIRFRLRERLTPASAESGS